MASIICKSRQEVNSLISEIQNITHTKYVVSSVSTRFNIEDWQPTENNNIYFEKKKAHGKAISIPFTGTPFVYIGAKYLACHHGKDKSISTKKKWLEQKMKAGDQDKKKRRYLVQNTKKINCPAELGITRVAAFLDKKFQIDKNIIKNRRFSSSLIKQCLKKKDKVTLENRYYVYVPKLEDHAGHPLTEEAASIGEAMDPRVKEKIKELTKQSQITSVTQMQKLIKDFVKDTIFKDGDPPEKLHRKYFPLDKDVQNIMKSAQDVAKHSNDDQENLQILIQGWREKNLEDNIFLRTQLADQDFLLCYQTKWQRRLLHLYGQDICFIDAAYKTTSYDLAQYFLFVRTNVCYVVAAVFVLQQETTETVSEALHMLKEWNEGWSPGHFLVDFNKAEINALESVFPDSKAVLWDFHREKAWEEWIGKLCNGIQNKDETLSLMRRIASADTMEKYQQAVKKLQDSEEWKKNTLFQQWFLTNWMTEVKRWGTVFQEEILHLTITTNNGVQRLNDTLKYSHHIIHKTSTISEMMSIIINDFIPNQHKKYTQLNFRFSSGYKKYNSTVPSFLHNRPRDMVRYIIRGYNDNLGSHHVTKITDLRFQVKSESDRKSYHVSLGSISEGSLPSCGCADWKRNKLPCKHFCAVFRAGWTWDNLCPKYRDNPLFTLDPICFTSSPIKHPTKEEENETMSYMCRQDEEGDDSINSPSEEKDGDDDDLPISKKIKTDINESRRRAIEHHKTISDLLYRLQDEKYMKEVEASLENLKNFIEARVPHQAEIALYNLPNPNQCMSTDATGIASEDDQALSVGQSQVDDILSKSEQRTPENDGHYIIKINSTKDEVWTVNDRERKRKEIQTSTDDDYISINNVLFNIGNFEYMDL